jgi:superfamily II DNA or RNA helicase
MEIISGDIKSKRFKSVMGTLCRSGYLTPHNKDTKKELTVRPIVNNDIGFPPPPFKVFKTTKEYICVPRFYGEEKFGPAVVDKRPDPARMNATFTGTLRKETHQIEALRKAIEAGHGVLSLPCGYGKTTVALAIACKLGLRTMIVVHKEFLANQWRERIQQFCPGATIGLVQKDTVDIEADFVIAMLQSLSQKEYTFEQFESVGTLIVDEAHHVCARVFSQALFKMCPKHVYGLSATPERKDGLTKVLHWFMGPTFFAVERKEQTAVTVTPVEFAIPRYKDPPPCNRLGKLCLPVMITELVEMPRRNALLVKIIKRASKGGRHVLVLSDRRLHCQYLHAQFPESGLYMGGMKEKDLEESSRCPIIFGTFSQAHEGLDIPTLDTLILATPKSDIKQSVGRILRETPGKKNLPRIWDIWDQWSVLNSMYFKRRKVYQEGGFSIEEKARLDEQPKITGFLFTHVICDGEE